MAKKYVEIEWREIRIKPFKDWGDKKFFLNIAANYPTYNNIEGAYYSQNCPKERLITSIILEQLESESWVISPKNENDQILFSGYVENLLQIAVTVLESDEESLINSFAENAEKLAEIFRGGGIPSKFFPFLGISSFVFSGIASFIKDRDDFIGSFLYQLRRSTTFPINRPLTSNLMCGNEKVGEIDIIIYVKPVEIDDSLFYKDVEIFPFAANEIGVYYSGELIDSEELYMLWTLDNWKTNPLVKMKYMGGYWLGLIEIPEGRNVEDYLELAFTNGEKNWDNKDGSNWIFKNFTWS